MRHDVFDRPPATNALLFTIRFRQICNRLQNSILTIFQNIFGIHFASCVANVGAMLVEVMLNEVKY
jgi:hypothetical protein